MFHSPVDVYGAAVAKVNVVLLGMVRVAFVHARYTLRGLSSLNPFIHLIHAIRLRASLSLGSCHQNIGAVADEPRLRRRWHQLLPSQPRR